MRASGCAALLLTTGLALTSCSGGSSQTDTKKTTNPPTDTSSQSASVPSATEATSASVEATVNTASGWRLEVSSPHAGTQVAQPFTICYAVTGPSRSATVVLAVSLERPPAAGPDAGVRRFAASVGRGSIRVPVGNLGTGKHDVRVRMIVDGMAQGSVVLDNLRISGDRSAAASTACD